MAFFLAGAEGLTNPDLAREFGMRRGFGSGAKSQQFRRIRAEIEGFCVFQAANKKTKKPTTFSVVLNGEFANTKFRQRTCFLCRFVV